MDEQAKLIASKFEWQDEYFAVSVSESILDRVREYIKNQEEHHRKKTFQEEYDEFLKRYGFQKFQD
ncbi:MAG TPA: transposase [Flavipsychrobacter sp.]|nr:transposase [Flavipsychrobacter sp.]